MSRTATLPLAAGGNAVTARDVIGACINVCAAAADERGRWRAERWCASTLDVLHPGAAGVNANTAAAARRFGAWLAGMGAQA
jgi:hypothetical protein